jgi:hypothetical protein
MAQPSSWRSETTPHKIADPTVEPVAAPRNDYGVQTAYAPPPAAAPQPAPEPQEDPNAPKRKGWWQRLTE